MRESVEFSFGRFFTGEVFDTGSVSSFAYTAREETGNSRLTGIVTIGYGVYVLVVPEGIEVIAET